MRQSVIKSVDESWKSAVHSKQDIWYVWTLDNKGIPALNSVHEISLNTRNTYDTCNTSAEVLLKFLLE